VCEREREREWVNDGRRGRGSGGLKWFGRADMCSHGETHEDNIPKCMSAMCSGGQP